MDEVLTNLPAHGKPVKQRAYRQVWRFEFGGRPYYLKFYPRRQWRLKRLIRGNPAMREFLHLQRLQKAGIPAPRPANVLVGFRLSGQIGDAVVLEGIEPSVTLDQYLNDLYLAAEPIPNRTDLARQLIDIVRRLGKANLGHADLHLGNFLLHENKLYLLDAYALRPGGLKMRDVLTLGQGAARFSTRADRRRAWMQLAPDQPMPGAGKGGRRFLRKFMERVGGENDWFGRIQIGPWRGHYFKRTKFPQRWSEASRLEIGAENWSAAWPVLLARARERRLEPMKTSPSADVGACRIALGNQALEVVVKRPYKRYWYRYFNEIGRGSRAWRAWIKAWKLIARNVPTAWPLLVMEKRTLGYVTDSIIVFERVPGPTLGSMDLDALPPAARQTLFRRVGHILRQIDARGLAHFDAKSSNWIVRDDAKLGPFPVLIDVDGVRSRRWAALGISRLLRSMRDHPQYTPRDSLDLCLGYAPFSAVPALEPQT